MAHGCRRRHRRAERLVRGVAERWCDISSESAGGSRARLDCLRHVSASAAKRQELRSSCRLRGTCSRSNLKALRVSDFAKGSKDIDDVRNLLARSEHYRDRTRHRHLDGVLSPKRGRCRQAAFCAKEHPVQGTHRKCAPLPSQKRPRIVDGTPQEKALPEFLDTFYLAPTAEPKLAAIADRPADTGDHHLDAFLARPPNILRGNISCRRFRIGCLSLIGSSNTPGMCRSSIIRGCAST